MSSIPSWSELSTLSKAGIIFAGAVTGLGLLVYSQVRGEPEPGIIDFMDRVDRSQIRVYKPPTKAELFAKDGPPSTSNYIPILILYGTEYGYSQRLAQRMRRALEQLSQDSEFSALLKGAELYPRALNMEDYAHLKWDQEHIVISIVSTYGEGVPPTQARDFFEKGLGCHFGEEMAYDDLSGASNPLGPRSQPQQALQFSVLALGDTQYRFYTRCGKTLDSRLEALGAQRIHPRIDVDLGDYDSVEKWFAGVFEAMKKTLVDNSEKWTRTGQDYLWDAISQDSGISFNRNNPFWADCVDKRPLTVFEDPAADKETLHFEFDLGSSELVYTVGDSLAVLAPTPESEIQHLLKVWGISPKTLVEKPVWAWPTKEGEVIDSNLPLERALQYYDIKNVQFKLLQNLLESTKGREKDVDQKQLARLNELITLGRTDAKAKQYLEESHASDVLSDFATVAKLAGPAVLLGALSDLKARYYSIASTQVVSPKTVSICVAVVRYSLRDRARKGVCSTHLADQIQKTTKVPIYVNKNPDFRLPKGDVDVLMVGPGTGLAPFRGMIQERVATKATGKNVLFFGCRNERDYLYRSELEEFQKNNQISLFVAFSRQPQQPKVYVQHMLANQADTVWNLLENNGYFYICGDGANMENDVRAAAIKIIQDKGNMSATAAEEYWKQLEKSKRVQKDTWI